MISERRMRSARARTYISCLTKYFSSVERAAENWHLPAQLGPPWKPNYLFVNLGRCFFWKLRLSRSLKPDIVKYQNLHSSTKCKQYIRRLNSLQISNHHWNQMIQKNFLPTRHWCLIVVIGSDKRCTVWSAHDFRRHIGVDVAATGARLALSHLLTHASARAFSVFKHLAHVYCEWLGENDETRSDGRAERGL